MSTLPGDYRNPNFAKIVVLGSRFLDWISIYMKSWFCKTRFLVKHSKFQRKKILKYRLAGLSENSFPNTVLGERSTQLNLKIEEFLIKCILISIYEHIEKRNLKKKFVI